MYLYKKVIMAFISIIAMISIGSCDLLFGDDEDDDENDDNSSYYDDDESEEDDANDDADSDSGLTFKITSSTYSETSDWDAAVSSAYGSGYDVADWYDLVDYYNENGLTSFKSLLTGLGLVGYGTSGDSGAFVTYNGSKSPSSDRYYFIARFDGTVPSTFLVHANIGSNTLCLGSWTGARKILALGTSTTTTSTGTISGTVLSATTGTGLYNVYVSVSGYSNYYDTTDSNGNFSIVIPQGTYTLGFLLTGYSFSDISVTVSSGTTTTVPTNQTIGSSAVQSGDLRLVLSWGIDPSDLDAHLVSPYNSEHLYYGDKSITGAILDVDDMSSYGPETVTISEFYSGTYKFYVHRYTGTGYLTTSSAVVKIYDSSGLLRTVTVPTSGSGDYWYVADITTTTVTVKNTIQSSAP